MTTARDWLTWLREAAMESGEAGRRLVARIADAEAGSADALADCARLATTDLNSAQRRERETSRYRCIRCGGVSWNQVCLTCDPLQHPSILDPHPDAVNDGLRVMTPFGDRWEG